MISPILFLDIDGVLNSADYMHNRRNIRRPSHHSIDAQAVPHLNAILRRSGAQVVVSSTWRLGRSAEDLQRILTLHGVECDVIGVTPRLIDDLPSGGCVEKHRGYEIQAWLDCADPKRTRFAIVDDNSDMANLMPRLVQTTWALGLLEEHIEPLVKMLLMEGV